MCKRNSPKKKKTSMGCVRKRRRKKEEKKPSTGSVREKEKKSERSMCKRNT